MKLGTRIWDFLPDEFQEYMVDLSDDYVLELLYIKVFQDHVPLSTVMAWVSMCQELVYNGAVLWLAGGVDISTKGLTDADMEPESEEEDEEEEEEGSDGEGTEASQENKQPADG